MVDPNFPKEGRRVDGPFPGLPEGWYGIEKMYMVGKTAGKTYLRFRSDKHSPVCTVRQAIEKDALHRGLDPTEELKRYEAQKEASKKEAELAKKEAGHVSKEMRESAIAAFEGKLGPLEAGVIPKMAGWNFEAKYLENCGQTNIRFYNPHGKPFGTVREVEASLGQRMLAGEEDAVVELVSNGRKAFIEEHGSLNPGYNPLRRTSDGSSLQKAKALGDEDALREVKSRGISAKELDEIRSKAVVAVKKRRTWMPMPEDYEESPQFALVRAETGDSLLQSGAPAEMADSLAQVRSLLSKRKFDENIEMVAVFGRASPSSGVAEVAGLYYPMYSEEAERPRYQGVRLSEKAVSGLSCRSFDIYWSAENARWQLGQRGSHVSTAFLDEDVGRPFDTKRPWKVLKDDWQSAPAPPTQTSAGAAAAEQGAKPEAAQPEEAQQSEAAGPESAKPEAAQPAGEGAEAAKPEEARQKADGKRGI